MITATYIAHVHVQLCPTLLRPPWTVAYQALLSIKFSRQAYWSGLPFLLQGIFLTQRSNFHLAFLALAGRFFTAVPPGKQHMLQSHYFYPQIPPVPLVGIGLSPQSKPPSVIYFPSIDSFFFCLFQTVL